MGTTEILFLVEDDPESGLTARAFGASIFVQGETMDEIRNAVRDAVACHFEDDQRPAVIRLHYVHDEVLAS